MHKACWHLDVHQPRSGFGARAFGAGLSIAAWLDRG